MMTNVSLPYFVAPNGMNLARSVKNPNSRLSRVREYLVSRGEATKAEILRDVFGKTIGVSKWNWDGTQVVCITPNVVSRGWATYLFSLSVKYGYFNKVRRGNKVFYSVNGT